MIKNTRSVKHFLNLIQRMSIAFFISVRLLHSHSMILEGLAQFFIDKSILVLSHPFVIFSVFTGSLIIFYCAVPGTEVKLTGLEFLFSLSFEDKC